jgi:multidrug efflux pump subunit AcrA (membrane-fusion protein)
MNKRNEKADARRTEASGEVDLPVRLTSPRDWLTVVVVAATVIGGCVWGATAKLSRSVAAGGLITSLEGAIAVQTPVGGQITEVRARQGQRVAPGSVLAVVMNEGGLSMVRAPAAGRVFSIPVHVGEVVAPGSVVVNAERGTPDERPVAVLFLPATVPAALTAGASVQLTVQSAPANQYGVLRGRIRSVDPLLSSRQEISEFVGDPALASAVAGSGGGRRVVVELLPSARTVSGYRWSTRAGPPFTIGTRTVVVGALPQPPERPVEWVVPR